MKPKAVVTGGAGFIGSEVVLQLERQGCDVFVIDDLSFGRREHAFVRDENFFLVDILDASRVQAAIDTIAPDWVVHLAAIHFIPYCNAHPHESSTINLMGTMNVLDAIGRTPQVQKLFFASTAAVYADSVAPVSEQSPAIPLDIYGLTKLVGERLVRDFHARTQIPCVIGRLFNAYGPRETNPHLIPEILRQVLEGRRQLELGNIATRRDYIHTADLARAIIQLMVREDTGVDVYNIGAGSSYTATDVVEYFERAANCSFDITVASDRVRKQDRAVLQADISKIRAAIDWTPQIRFDEGIRALVAEERHPSEAK